MGIIDSIENWVEKRADPEGHSLEITNKAQMELMREFGEDRSGVWIDAYARRFRELVDEPESDLLERLADESTHADAVEEIKRKLYH